MTQLPGKELKTGIQTKTYTQMIICIFTITKRWKQPKCPSDKWISKLHYVHTVEYN